MKTVVQMVVASVAVWVAVALAAGDSGTRVAVLFGMAGPLAVASVSWVLAERTYRRNPESLTPLMITAFGGKMLFFAAYVIVMLRGLELPQVAFVASFAGYFIALHLIEALSLRRLFAL